MPRKKTNNIEKPLKKGLSYDPVIETKLYISPPKRIVVIEKFKRDDTVANLIKKV